MRVLFLLFFLITSILIRGQSPIFTITEMAQMPEPVSNNAVTEGISNGNGYIYSFGGLDSTKLWSGIHLRSFRYNISSDVWDTIPSLPDTLGKIAAGASWVDSIIYIIGGYHVYANSNEASSAKVHRYDPRTNSYLSDGMDIPIPIDDHVQAVYKDSLIYVITGWSNTGNVPNVQIYDPGNDNWLVGTSIPNNNTYRAFGASGNIVGDTIYYHGGASTGFNFPGQSNLRKGYINPLNPIQITWFVVPTPQISYRSAAIKFLHYICWIGGSSTTYNYNAIAYNGSGGVTQKSTGLYFNSLSSSIDTLSPSVKLPMDLRGYGEYQGAHYIVGGIVDNQKVSNKTLRLTGFIDGIEENLQISFKIFPNPTSSYINFLFDDIELKTIQLINVIGNEIIAQQTLSKNVQLDVSNYPKGIYFVNVSSEKGSSTQKIIIQ